MKWTGCFILIMLFTTPLEAQRHVERHLSYSPFNKAVEAEQRWMPSFAGWAEFGKFTGHKDTHHEWHHQIGGVIELVRWDRNSISFTTQAEFIYDPHNEIDFNPRSIFWEEGILYTRQYERYDLQLYYYHRCKHDIDNLGLGLERVTINGSLGSRWLIGDMDIAGGNLFLTPGAEVYSIVYDNRTPDEYMEEGLSWYQMLGSVSNKFSWSRGISEQFSIYSSGYINFTFFGSYPEEGSPDSFTRFNGYEDTRISGAASAGIQIEGAGSFRIGLRYEYLDDAAIHPKPHTSSLLSIKIRAFSPGLLY